MANQIDGDVTINGALNVLGSISGPIARTNLMAEANTVVGVPLSEFVVWDSVTQAFLPSVGAADDCGMVLGAFGTALPYIGSKQLNAAGASTQYARTQVVVPPEYIAGNAISIRVYGGMITSVASVSATVDCELYKAAKTSTLVSGSDLVSTAATTINSLTFAAVTFVVTPTTVSPGDLLDLRLALITNSATASSHFAAVSAVDFLYATRG